MKILKALLVIVVLAVVAFFVWNWFFGPLKAKRQGAQFADAMESCTPVDQTLTALTGGQTLTRAVKGRKDGNCRFEIQALSPNPMFMVCEVPLDQMPALAESFRKQNANIGLFGITRMQIDTESEDPMQTVMNSDACQLETR